MLVDISIVFLLGEWGEIFGGADDGVVDRYCGFVEEFNGSEVGGDVGRFVSIIRVGNYASYIIYVDVLIGVFICVLGLFECSYVGIMDFLWGRFFVEYVFLVNYFGMFLRWVRVDYYYFEF